MKVYVLVGVQFFHKDNLICIFRYKESAEKRVTDLNNEIAKSEMCREEEIAFTCDEDAEYRIDNLWHNSRLSDMFTTKYEIREVDIEE